jgi:hypothetical protein
VAAGILLAQGTTSGAAGMIQDPAGEKDNTGRTFPKTPSFGCPALVYTNSTFGRIRDTVSSYSRQIQIGAKLNF